MNNRRGLQFLLEQQLICECCTQPYYPHMELSDRLKAFVSRPEKYRVCPICTQAVPEQTFHDCSYRVRWEKHFKRLMRDWEAHERKRKKGK